jgi:hypothetical protein
MNAKRFLWISTSILLMAACNATRGPSPVPTPIAAASGDAASPIAGERHPPSPAQAPRATFRLLSSHTSASRDGGTATLLADGRVLVVGGFMGGGSSADLWDPGTEEFTPTGGPLKPRYGHAASLLPDGRVLVSGGTEQPQPDELWDPEAGVFQLAGDMKRPDVQQSPLVLDEDGRGIGADAARVRLGDGSVLLAGGMGADRKNPDRGCLRDASIWDPTTRQSVPIEPLAIGRAHPVGVLLTDGRVLIVGNHFTCTMLASAEILEWT